MKVGILAQQEVDGKALDAFGDTRVKKHPARRWPSLLTSDDRPRRAQGGLSRQSTANLVSMLCRAVQPAPQKAPKWNFTSVEG